MDVILNERIREKIYQLEGIKNHVTVPHTILITSTKQIIDIGNAFYFLVNKNLNDLPETSRLRLRSSDNSFTTSQLDYANLELARYECFRDYLDVEVFNCTNLAPFKLEFLKVQPIYHDIN